MNRTFLRRAWRALAAFALATLAAGAAQAGLYAMPSANGSGIRFFDAQTGAAMTPGPFQFNTLVYERAVQVLEVGSEVWVSLDGSCCGGVGVDRYDRASGTLLGALDVPDNIAGMTTVGETVYLAHQSAGGGVVSVGFDGSVLGSFATTPLSAVRDVMDFNGSLLVSGTSDGVGTLVRYSYSGKYLGTWFSGAPGQSSIEQITLAPNGDVWAMVWGSAPWTQYAVQLRDGQALASYPLTAYSGGPGGSILANGRGIAVLGNGEILYSGVALQNANTGGGVFALNPATGSYRVVGFFPGGYFQAVAVPEPATLLLWLPGLGLLVALRRRRG